MLGILLVNIVSMGLPFAAHNDPTIAGNRSAADFWAWAVTSVVAEGEDAGDLFDALARERAAPQHSHRVAGRNRSCGQSHLRRNLWLIVFGPVHSVWLLWPGDILFTYSVAGLPLFAFGDYGLGR